MRALCDMTCQIPPLLVVKQAPRDLLETIGVFGLGFEHHAQRLDYFIAANIEKAHRVRGPQHE